MWSGCKNLFAAFLFEQNFKNSHADFGSHHLYIFNSKQRCSFYVNSMIIFPSFMSYIFCDIKYEFEVRELVYITYQLFITFNL